MTTIRSLRSPVLYQFLHLRTPLSFTYPSMYFSPTGVSTFSTFTDLTSKFLSSSHSLFNRMSTPGVSNLSSETETIDSESKPIEGAEINSNGEPTEMKSWKERKPLDVYFKEAVGINEREQSQIKTIDLIESEGKPIEGAEINDSNSKNSNGELTEMENWKERKPLDAYIKEAVGLNEREQSEIKTIDLIESEGKPIDGTEINDSKLKNSSGESKEMKNRKERKPLDVYFKEAVGINEREQPDTESESELLLDLVEDERSDGLKSKKTKSLKEKLRQLEKKVRLLQESKTNSLKNQKEEDAKRLSSLFLKPTNKNVYDEINNGTQNVGDKHRSLHSLFAESSQNIDTASKTKSKQLKNSTNKVPGKGNETIIPELTSEAADFVERLYEEGYLNDSSYLNSGKFDINCFSSADARNYLKSPAEKFGRNHQEIAKWLSGSNLKTIALFGCPSDEKKTIYASKKLRSFFGIPETSVCESCSMKDTCKFANKSAQKGDLLLLTDAIRVLTTYALELTSPSIRISNEVKDSVSILLKEVLNLTK